ncbi:MAG: hypothetical protein ABSB78_11535 [Bacteroidota bacterium]
MKKLKLILLIVFLVFVYSTFSYSQKDRFEEIFSMDSNAVASALHNGHIDCFDKSPICLDSIHGQLTIGVLGHTGRFIEGPFEFVSDVDSTIIIFINKAGDILKSTKWIKKPKELFPYPYTFRNLDSRVFVVGKDQKGIEVNRLTGSSILTPWHPDNINLFFPKLSIGYWKDEFMGMKPLLQVQKGCFLTVGSDSIFRKYDFKGNILLSIEVNIPKFFITQPSDLIVGADEKYLYLYDAPDDLMKINLANSKIEKYNLREIFTEMCHSTIEGDGEVSGISLYVWEGTPFFIVCAEKGIFVYKYELSCH